MKNRGLSGGVLAVLGALMALVPKVIFPTCTKMIETAAGSTVPMKCHWMGHAEIGIGVLLLCAGVLLMLLQSTQARMGVSVLAMLVAILSLLITNVLIGGCMMETMACRMTTMPALNVLSGLAAVLCAANALWLRAQNKKSGGA